MQCASHLAINLSTITHECCDSYSAPGFTAEGADKVSIYIVSKEYCVAGILLSMTFRMLSSEVQICEINLNAHDASSVVALLEELDQAYIWMVGDG